jgi:hypothetical protein
MCAQVVVITGDNKLTAEAICRTIGVFGPAEGLKGKSMTGREFAELPLEDRKAILAVRAPSCRCFLRLALLDMRVSALQGCSDALLEVHAVSLERLMAWLTLLDMRDPALQGCSDAAPGLHERGT